MSNYFFYKTDCEYSNDIFYRPDKLYPEYLFGQEEVSDEKNDVYEMIRQLFWEMGFDKENFGMPSWNPLGQFIKRGQTVLIKPNLVLDKNTAEKNRKRGMDCLITHPSVVRCIIDYVLIALGESGKLVVGDAPIQNCDFDKLIRSSGYQILEKFYQTHGVNDFEIKDLRKIVSENDNGNLSQSENRNMAFEIKTVNLSTKSYFYGENYHGKLRITNYDAKDTNIHHHGRIQEYSLNAICLDADVIINMPKPKTHRLAGYTGALKNFVGINAQKEYLPHHRKGEIAKSGDEYPAKDNRKRISSFLDDLKNKAYKKNWKLISGTLLHLNGLIMKNHKDQIRYGMWYGNDTIWRTILDINRIVNYSDKDGTIKSTIQRRIINIGDMLVCGEKEGPLSPSYKKVGGILFSDNAVEFDLFLTRLMGFDFSGIPTLEHAIQDKKLFQGDLELDFHSNVPQYTGGLNDAIDNFGFIPTSGWKGYL